MKSRGHMQRLEGLHQQLFDDKKFEEAESLRWALQRIEASLKEESYERALDLNGTEKRWLSVLPTALPQSVRLTLCRCLDLASDKKLGSLNSIGQLEEFAQEKMTELGVPQ